MQWLNVRGVSKMIESIKNQVLNHLNKEVKVVSKEKLNKSYIFYVNITEIYSNVFIVDNGIEKRSYSYSDILSNDIFMTFL